MDDWNISKSAICLLTLLSQCCDINLINSVTEFISLKLSDDNYLNKEIAMIAFGAILSTSLKPAMTFIVFSSLQIIIKFLKSSIYPNSLKRTTGWVLLRIAKFYGDIFTSNPIAFNELINEIIDIMQNATKKITFDLITTLHLFAKNTYDENNLETNLFTTHTKKALDNLLNMAFISNAYDSRYNIASEAFLAMGAISQYSTFSCREILEDFFNKLYQAFESTLNPSYFPEEKKRNNYQEYICHCFFCGFSSGIIQINEQNTFHIAKIIMQSFEIRNGIYEEGLIAISKSACILGKNFEQVLKENFLNYLIYSLKNTQDISICKNAIISTTEIIQSLQENFVNFADEILGLIYNILLVIKKIQ
jgi:importin subunit beta-1